MVAGGVVGLAAAPLLSQLVGWPLAFVVTGMLGLVWALAGSRVLSDGWRQEVNKDGPTLESSKEKPRGGLLRLSPPLVLQVAVLCWAHAVIGWGFFILQNWIPMYVTRLGVSQLSSAGLLSSLPWLAASVVAVAVGAWPAGCGLVAYRTAMNVNT